MHGTHVMGWEHEALRRREQLLDEARAVHRTAGGGWSVTEAVRRSWQRFAAEEQVAAAPCPEVRLAHG